LLFHDVVDPELIDWLSCLKVEIMLVISKKMVRSILLATCCSVGINSASAQNIPGGLQALFQQGGDATQSLPVTTIKNNPSGQVPQNYVSPRPISSKNLNDKNEKETLNNMKSNKYTNKLKIIENFGDFPFDKTEFSTLQLIKFIYILINDIRMKLPNFKEINSCNITWEKYKNFCYYMSVIKIYKKDIINNTKLVQNILDKIAKHLF
jgi:hypothetical protein